MHATSPMNRIKSHPIRLAVVYLGRHKARLASAVFWRSLYVLAPMQVPILTGAIADALAGGEVAFFGRAWSGSPQEAFTVAVAGLFGVALLYGLGAYVRLVETAKLSRRFVTHLRKALVEKLALLPLAQQRAYGTGELLSRVVSDTARMRRFVDRVFVQALTNVLRVGFPIVMLFVLDPRLALVALVIVPPQWFLVRALHRRLHRTSHAARNAQASLTTAVQEHLDGAESIQTLHAEEATIDRTHERAEVLEERELKRSTLSAGVGGVTWLMTGLGFALTWWLGGQQVLAGEMTLGTLIAFTGFVEFAYRPFRQFSTIANTYQSGLVALERIHDLLSTGTTLPVPAGAPALQVRDGHVVFDQVRLAYGTQRVLDGVCFEAAPRSVTAVVGRSGSGKSTLLRLVGRLLDPDAGQVRIDGQALDGVTLDSVRARVAFVPQQPVLFSGTILENLRIGRPDASPADVRAACEAASARGFIEEAEEGFETRIGHGGVCLSGGQAQRLALARALLCRPRILLLDEPTSALDVEAEAAIVETLRRLAQTMTVVVVAHRWQTIRCADRVVLLEAGRVVAQGTHETLMLEEPRYHDLFIPEARPAAGRQAA